MKIHKVKYQTYDIFLNYNTHPTGYEENCWLRVYIDKSNKFHQIGGISLPKFKFTQIIKTAEIAIKLQGL